MSGEQTLSGQVAIVTGSGRGIGAVVARTLAEHGASIVVADILEERAQQTADAIVANGGHALPIHVDTRDRKNVDAMIEQTVARFGRIDILVNNAGIARTATFLDTSLEDWNDHIGINLSGCFHCAQSAARVMAKAGYGRIISIASIVERRTCAVRVPDARRLVLGGSDDETPAGIDAGRPYGRGMGAGFQAQAQPGVRFRGVNAAGQQQPEQGREEAAHGRRRSELKVLSTTFS